MKAIVPGSPVCKHQAQGISLGFRISCAFTVWFLLKKSGQLSKMDGARTVLVSGNHGIITLNSRAPDSTAPFIIFSHFPFFSVFKSSSSGVLSSPDPAPLYTTVDQQRPRTTCSPQFIALAPGGTHFDLSINKVRPHGYARPTVPYPLKGGSCVLASPDRKSSFIRVDGNEPSNSCDICRRRKVRCLIEVTEDSERSLTIGMLIGGGDGTSAVSRRR